ncbi:hypothetical protein FBU59_001041, partial [Linderina macrospora]
MDRNDQRVPYTRDPLGLSDHIIAYGGLALYGATLLVLIYAWINYKYPPLKARNLTLITIMYLSGLGWFAGSIMGNELVMGEWLFRACRGWMIWLRVGCMFVFTCTVAFRLYALDRVFVQGKTYRGWSMYAPFILLGVFALVFCTVSQLVPDRLTVIYLDHYEICHYVYAYRYVCIAMGWAMWTLCHLLAWRCRNIHTCFNEYRESILTVVLGHLDDLQMTLVHVYLPDYALYNWQRGIAASCDLLVTLVGIWVVLLYPTYQCLFHHDEYLQKWLTKLSQDGKRREYEVEGDTTKNNQISGQAKRIESLHYDNSYNHSQSTPFPGPYEYDNT